MCASRESAPWAPRVRTEVGKVIYYFNPQNVLIMVSYKYCTILRPVPNRYPNPSRYSVFLLIPHPTRFSFENLRVAKYLVIFNI